MHEGLTVGWTLDLHGSAVKTLPALLTVGGYLDLQYIDMENLPEYLTVGGNLYLEGTDIKTLPATLTVGGYIDLENTDVPFEQTKKVNKLSHGEYVEGRYLYADGLLTPIQKMKKLGFYTYYVGKIPNRHVISDGTHFAHCRNMREGVEDLLFKIAEERGVDQYRHLSLDSVVKTEEAIQMYRVITGACRSGVQQFIENLNEEKAQYTIQEILKLTKGRYRSEVFEAFFMSER